MKKLSSALAILAAFTVLCPVAGDAQNAAEGRKLYASLCTTCHGEKGKGDGVAAGSLPVKPQDHTNSAVMSQMTDQALADVIIKGGGGIGKSPFMPAWGSSLNERQVRDIIAYIRTLSGPARP